MKSMTNGFLNASRLESGKIHINKKRFDMKDLMKEIEDETIPVNTAHNIIFDPVLTTWVKGDRDKVGQVITNFISNGLKYSAMGTTVLIARVAEEGTSKEWPGCRQIMPAISLRPYILLTRPAMKSFIWFSKTCLNCATISALREI